MQGHVSRESKTRDLPMQRIGEDVGDYWRQTTHPEEVRVNHVVRHVWCLGGDESPAADVVVLRNPIPLDWWGQKGSADETSSGAASGVTVQTARSGMAERLTCGRKWKVRQARNKL